MRPEASFILRALGWSAALYSVWWLAITTTEGLWLIEDGGFVILAAAVLLASRFETRYTVQAIGALALIFVLGDVAAFLSGMRAIWVDDVYRQSGSLGAWSVSACYHAFKVGLPIAAILVATGGDLGALWREEADGATRMKECPFCGKRRIGLEAHIRASHGEKALAKARTRGQM